MIKRLVATLLLTGYAKQGLALEPETMPYLGYGGWSRIVHQMEGWEPDDIVSILFNNSDYRANIVERSGSSSSPVVVSAILSITKRGVRIDIPFKRSSFRNFMKE